MNERGDNRAIELPESGLGQAGMGLVTARAGPA